MPPRIACIIFFFLLLVASATAAHAANSPFPFLNSPLVPTATPPGGPAFSLTVNGTGFVSGAIVDWNGSPRATTFVSNSRLTAAITAADIDSAGTAAITVTNPAPGGGTSLPLFFQISNPTVGLAFQPAPISAGNFEVQPVVGDFNRDGKLDVVVSAARDNLSQILLGNGDGTFRAPMNVLVGPSNPLGNVIAGVQAVADVNGDGKPDLIGWYYETFDPPSAQAPVNGTVVMLGNGDGTFQAPLLSYPSSAPGSNMTIVADINGDGIPDLVHATTGGFYTEFGRGDGTFEFGTQYGGEQTSNYSIAVGDFRKLGLLDVVAAIGSPASVLTLFLNNGQGQYYGTGIVDFPPFNTTVQSIVAADFYNSGNLDIAYYYESPYFRTTASLRLLAGNGEGGFQQVGELDGLPVSSNGFETLITGDFNGDGHLDMAVDDAIILLLSPHSHSVITAPSYVYAAGDFNRDGKLDFLTLDTSSNVLGLVLQTEPSADFAGALNPSYQNIITGTTGIYGITVTAFNEFSGTVQFVATGLPAGATAAFTPGTITGSGNTTLTITTTSATPTGSYPITVSGTSGSLTHTGTADLNVAPPGTDQIDFTGSISPQFQTVVPGGSTTYNINVSPLYGFDGNVSLTVSGLPPGATSAFSPGVIPGGSGSSILTVTTTSPTPTATYPLLVTATAGSHVHMDGVSLNVGPSGTDFTDYTGSLTPQMQTISATSGNSATFTAYIEPLNGTGCITLQVSALPSGTTGKFDRTTSICGSPATTVYTVTPTPATPPGTYALKFTGTTTGGHAHTASVSLVVTP